VILCTWPRSWFYLLGLTTDFMYWFGPRSYGGSSWLWLYGSWIYNSLCNQYLSPLMLWVRISIRARCTTLCDTVCQRLATGRWFSPGPPVSSTNKTDRNDITEALLKVAFNTIKQANAILRIWSRSGLYFSRKILLVTLSAGTTTYLSWIANRV
jgi:hypothetical protein